jgi:outer membrane protein OmpA-like peptidoglycan-associated protein
VVRKKANPQAKRLPDIVFLSGSARVNNCGKRVLLEELKALISQDPAGKVVLVGHIADREPKKTKLDARRATNAAAIVSAGKGICLNFPASQILVKAAGTTQEADFQPYFCGTSAAPKTRERGGQGVSAKDKNAQARRVEVWFVPSGAQIPASGAGAQDASGLKLGPLGCPR